MSYTRTLRRLSPVLIATSLALAACSGDGETTNPLALELEADTLQGEVPLAVNFDATTEPPRNDLSYRWTFGEGGSSAGSQSRAYVFDEPGSYPVSVNVIGGGLSARDELTVEVTEAGGPSDISNRPPTASLAAADVNEASPLEVDFLVIADDPNGSDTLSYSLDFGDGERASTNRTTHTYAAPGFYLATVVVTDGRGGVAIAEAEVTLE